MSPARSSQILRALAHAWRMTNPWYPMIRDARDRPCALYRLDRSGHTLMPNADLPAEVFARIRSRLMAQSTRGMGGPPAVLFFIAAVQLAMFALNWSLGFRGSGPWFSLAFAGMFVFFAFTYRYRIPKVERAEIAAALLLERRCPSCAYDLASTPPDSDILTTCPECGAVWRIAHPPA
jgi:hypothetical protein